MSELHRSFEHLASDLRAAANPERAPQMAAYLGRSNRHPSPTSIQGCNQRSQAVFYVEKRAADTEFFIRKALGWALRDYARVAPDAVRDFVNSHQEALSGLTKREALKHL